LEEAGRTAKPTEEEEEEEERRMQMRRLASKPRRWKIGY
jgi:hypothetical protein